jgi:hypothetical protein
LYKTDLELELYLSVTNFRKYRIALTKFRCSSHKLAIERLRGKTIRENRFCKYCLNLNLHIVEDEFHFLLVCPLYQNLRDQYISSYIQNISLHTFVYLMCFSKSDKIIKLACFVYHASICYINNLTIFKK